MSAKSREQRELKIESDKSAKVALEIDFRAGKREGSRERRSAIKIMGQLMLLVRPLLHIMLAAILLGTLGYLCAIFLTILAVQILIHGIQAGDWSGVESVSSSISNGFFSQFSTAVFCIMLVVLAVLRGVLHYAEQYCNHYIAFKLLAIIRHKVFAALRRLCPAKLEGRDKGNLISILTTDIELLEVFYAHTISPIAIAVCTSVIMVVFISSYHIYAGMFALAAYAVVGAVIPLWNGKHGGKQGMEFRTAFGELNSFVLDSLYGLDETIQYGQGTMRNRQMQERSKHLGTMQGELNRMEGKQRAFTNLSILVSSFGMMFLSVYLYQKGQVGFDGLLTCTISMMGSFGPAVALSSLSNNLNQTLASGERVLSILEEEPLVEEIMEEADKNSRYHDSNSTVDSDGENKKCDNVGGKVCLKNTNKIQREFTGAEVKHVTFAYEEEVILDNYSLSIPPGKIIGIHGASGSGKSTMLKLLMRFWDVDQGKVLVSGENVKKIPTKFLRDTEGYVTQETHLFHDSIANNIAIGKKSATREEIMEAAKKASIHAFIMTLPQKYDTEVGELGDTLSGGEKQRIGIARAFLHDAPFLLLDEPTSNLDSLNEGVILKSLKEECDTKTVLLVSHRKSTMTVADTVYEMNTPNDCFLQS